MEKLALMALLECPLCYEQLDVSAKVLPCQHTFCTHCLQRQEAAHSQLLCPECRAPTSARTVEELPANPLLVRLLDGLQGSLEPRRETQTARYTMPMARQGQQKQQQESQHREKYGHSEVSALTLCLSITSFDSALGDNFISKSCDEFFCYNRYTKLR